MAILDMYAVCGVLDGSIRYLKYWRALSSEVLKDSIRLRPEGLYQVKY